MNEIANNKVNLCDSCSQVYPDCTSKPENVYFGDGIGHDNICACSEYQPKSSELKRDSSDTISRQAAIDFIDAGHLCNPNEPRWSDNEVVNFLKSRPSAQLQLEECPIYGGMCGYPSNLCYECPRHGGAHEKPLWWTEGLQPFAQPQRIKGRWTKAYDGYDGHVKCVQCFKTYDWDTQAQYYNFCPNCGAWMSEESEPEHTMDEFMHGQDLGSPEDGSL